MIAAWPGRAWRRRTWFGLQTLLGRERRGFFIPYRYAAALPTAGRRPVYGAVEERLAACQADFADVLARLSHYGDALAAIGDEAPPAPRWTQDWFPRLDAAVAYALVRDLKPARILEVGSGHSTRFLMRAIADGGLASQVTALDPAPRAALEGLAVELRREALPGCGLTPFQALSAGDLLMIDSSHILMPGSDVDFLFGCVLPALPAGVWVQIHDIFLPDDYPADWDWRGYNEQLGVLPLLFSRDWAPRFASHYVRTRMAAAVAESAVAALPLLPSARESTLWLEKTTGPSAWSRSSEALAGAPAL